MSSDKLKSWAKINLSLNVIKRQQNNYHKIESLITFAQIFESIIFNQEHSNWKNSEVLRQNQKSLQNFIGEFHQNILCELDGCYRPKEGVDFICDEKKLLQK